MRRTICKKLFEIPSRSIFVKFAVIYCFLSYLRLPFSLNFLLLECVNCYVTWSHFHSPDYEIDDSYFYVDA